MTALISLLIVLFLSLLVVRIATVALTVTGLSEGAARFQARSAFTGTGFTTREAESVVDHPVRRRIIMLLMILRNAGIVTAVSSLILSFVNTLQSEEGLMRLGWLLGGIIVLWLLSISPWVDRQLSRLIRWALRKWTHLDVRDYVSLLHLAGNYAISEMQVEPGDWIAETSLRDLDLGGEGVLVLGIERGDGTYVGAPTGDTIIEPGDNVLLYGRGDVLEELDERQTGGSGDEAHRRSVAGQQDVLREQERADPGPQADDDQTDDDEPGGRRASAHTR
jgi:hypothetical protein